MGANQSLWIYFAEAGTVIKIVMLLLLAASVISWTFIFQRAWFFKKARVAMQQFDDQFWSGGSLSKFYNKICSKPEGEQGLGAIFTAGFDAYLRLRKQGNLKTDEVMEGVQRAMRISQARETEKLESHLTFLASVGSISPYVGLFGTVWGIMASFHALGSVQQASIAMVAPGISEALIATAMGLFAAIPAVLAYNRYTNKVDRVLNQFDTFQDEFSTILYRQARNQGEQAS